MLFTLFTVTHSIDRGGLLYPSESLTLRLWTIYKFVDVILPSISSCSHLLDDIVSFLSPRLLKCSDLRCNKTSANDTKPHNTDIVDLILRKFVSPILKNHRQVLTEVGRGKPVTMNKPAKRSFEISTINDWKINTKQCPQFP